MAKIRDVPLGTYPAGTYLFGPHATPNGLEGFDIRVGRCTSANPTIWSDPNTIVTIHMQFSYDGGNTYTAIGANSYGPRRGGIIVQRGVELAEDFASWRFAPDEPDHLKGTIIIEGPAIKSYLDVTIL